jgi:hypothetical protein
MRPRRDDDDDAEEEEERRIWVDLTVESRDLDSDPERKAIVSLGGCVSDCRNCEFQQPGFKLF